ncbi:hypothetical protein R3P38DRAFT_2829264 [Favolaschia claudopus]|uniref:NADH dehydrogenase [ubiquinone] 1 alpha subcomplex subunit 4 n=1 Tax=Favolaschia claudopus TaxID=2862362 RepID=A0AAW0EAW2_9AGAR
MPATLRTSMRPWMAVEAAPIVVLVAGMVSFASYFTYRSAMGPTIQWTKANSEPWNTIRPDQGVKMVEVNHRFNKSWHRDHI